MISKHHPLSDTEVLHLSYGLNDKQPLPDDDCVKFVVYNELKQPPACNCAYVLLYRSDENFGHYTALINRDDEVLEFFDPYNHTPDRELAWSKDKNQELGQTAPLLSNIMRKFEQDGGHLEYNEVAFQKDMEYDQSCGYNVGIRILFRDIPLTQYQNAFKYLSKTYKRSIPNIIISLGKFILGE